MHRLFGIRCLATKNQGFYCLRIYHLTTGAICAPASRVPIHYFDVNSVRRLFLAKTIINDKAPPITVQIMYL